MTVAIIVQARMTSTRLPGKVLKTVLGKPLLAYLLERLQRCRYADFLVVATTVNATDDPIVALCRSLDVRVYRGSEADVLGRYDEAAREVKADTVVRVTSDCPLLDPAVVDQVIARYREGGYDYVSNTLERTFPRGMDTEAFSFRGREEAAREATEPFHREHVTPFFYTQPERYRLGRVYFEKADSDWAARYRWTVDTPEDFELIRRILEALYPDQPRFTLADLLALLDRHPDWSALNANYHVGPVEAPHPRPGIPSRDPGSRDPGQSASR